MLVICCECKAIIKYGPPKPISHGYCEACSAKLLWLDGLSRKELTDFVNKMKRRKSHA